MTRPTRTPEAQESLDGFLRRLAEMEFWPDVSSFLAGFGLRYGRRMIEEASQAEELLDLEPGTLAPVSPTVAPSEPSRSWRFERHHSAPVCPDCLAAGKPHHQSWRHAFVTCCVEHGLRLVDQCPMCQEIFLPGRGGYDSCHCGCPLDRLERIAANDDEIAISALISGKMHPTRSRLSPALAFRTPSDIGEFIFFLASGGMDAVTGKKGKAPLPRTVEEARGFLADTFRLLCDWPTAFRDDVARRLREGEPSASSAPARLGRWYQRLMSFDSDAYADFRQALGEIVGQEFDGPYVGSVPVAACERDWISAAEASRIIGIRAERLVDAAGRGQIEGRQDTSGFGHRHTMVHRGTIEEICANRRRFVGKSGAREFLGTSRKQYDLFVEAGGLARCIHDAPPPLVEGAHDLEAMRALVNGIAARAMGTTADTVSFADLNLRFTTDRAGLIKVFQQVINGRLRPVAGSTEGRLAAFRFCRAEVETVLTEVRRGPGLTVQQVAQITGWKEQCIAAWCSQDLLAHETYDHAGRTGRTIQLESLLRFQSMYLPLSELAKQMDTTSRYLIRRLNEVGIETVGAFQDGKAWRGHLVTQAAVAGAVLDASPTREA